MLYKQVEKEIEQIFKIGREEYKRVYRESDSIVDFTFNVIHHHDQSSSLESDYSKWLQSINEVLAKK